MNIIERLRREKGLSQKDLANILGVSQSAISKYETGVALPSLNTARKIAAALDCTIDELFGEPEKEKEEVQ